MKKDKIVLMSSLAIPAIDIGSWTVLLTSFLKKYPSFFDTIVSPLPSSKIEGVSQVVVEPQKFKYFIEKNFNQHYAKQVYWKKLKESISNQEKTTVVIFDDTKILLAIDHYAKKEGIRKNLKIVFFLRGFNFGEDITKRNQIYTAIDTLVVQTETSVQQQIANNHALPFEIRILRNGIKSDVFYPLESQEKLQLRSRLGLKENIQYFLWVSQNRPKKGLQIILKAWQKVIKKQKGIELLVLGTDSDQKLDNITFLGRKSNEELAPYYQATDYYLFSSLCHEGHPLSLTEALKSGAKCLASNINPISEILHHGDLGYLVDNPNIVKNWVNTIEFVLMNDVDFNKKNVDLKKIYCFNDWSEEFQSILEEA